MKTCMWLGCSGFRIGRGPMGMLVVFLLGVQPLLAWQTTVSGTGSTTTNGKQTTTPISTTYVEDPNGSKSITGFGSSGAFGDPDINGEDHYTAVSGEASAAPGILRAKVSGIALNFSHVPNVPPLAYALGATGGFGATLQDSVLVTSDTLNLGDPIQLRMIVHIEVAAVGTYRVGGDYDLTAYAPGSFYLAAYAGLNAGVTYSFPNGLYKQVPSFSYDYPLLVDTTVGSNVGIYVTLGVGIEDRAGLWPNGTFYSNNESIVDASHTVGINIDSLTPGAILTSESGHDYSTVPEPSGYALIFLSIGIVLLRLRCVGKI